MIYDDLFKCKQGKHIFLSQISTDIGLTRFPASFVENQKNYAILISFPDSSRLAFFKWRPGFCSGTPTLVSIQFWAYRT